MIELKIINRRNLKWHIIFYTVLLIFAFIMFNDSEPALDSAFYSLLTTFIIAAFSMMNFYLLNVLLYSKKVLGYILALIVLLITLIYLINFIFIKVYPEETNYSSIIFAIIAFAMSTFIEYFLRDVKSQISRKEQEVSRVQSELDLLKSQINPHFLFNALNTTYSLAQMNKDNETATAISKLSNLLRFMIYSSKFDKINLEEEIEYIKNYIDFQSYKFLAHSKTKVEFSTSGNFENVNIVPLLLIPFIENVFKYGISNSRESLIKILISEKNNEICLQTQNPINNLDLKESKSSGLGIKNVKKRLELLYPNKHILRIESDEKVFEVNLRIQCS